MTFIEEEDAYVETVLDFLMRRAMLTAAGGLA
jgi:hypothetical protein